MFLFGNFEVMFDFGSRYQPPYLLLPWRHHSADLSLTNRRVSAVGSVENCAALGFRDLDQRSPQRAVNLHVY